MKFHRLLPLLALLIVAAPLAAEPAVWTPDPLEAVAEGPDCAGRDDPKCEIRLAGARNGTFSGQAVVSFKTPTTGPDAKVSDLKRVGGGGAIPASAVEVRYGLPTGANGWSKLPKGISGFFDALASRPRPTGTVHPVWVTVNVPADAAAGDYEGRLSLAGRDVPVRVAVADWKLPGSRDFATWVDFIESPESVAMRYDVPLWSERHWELVGQVWDQLDRVGNKTLYVPLMCQTHFGNSQSMVRWIKGDKPRQFTHDFSIAERYLDLRIKHAGKPAIVVLYLYESLLGGSHGRSTEECQVGVPFSLLDPKTGHVTTASGPGHNNANPAYPNYPQDTIDFWKPVVDGMRQRLNARGIGDECITLGMSPDLSPGNPTMDYLAKTFPYARWCRQGHQPMSHMGAMSMGYATAVYGWGSIIHFRPDQVLAAFDRDVWKADYPVQLVRGRVFTEHVLSQRLRGVGRLSADFWPCLKGPRGTYRLVNHYPRSAWAQLSVNNQAITWPADGGPVGAVRLEMLREGVQECEARLFIERALKDAASRAKLGDELAGRVGALLAGRLDPAFNAALGGLGGGANDAMRAACAKYVHSGWEGRSANLFDAAAEAAKTLRTH